MFKQLFTLAISLLLVFGSVNTAFGAQDNGNSSQKNKEQFPLSVTSLSSAVYSESTEDSNFTLEYEGHGVFTKSNKVNKENKTYKVKKKEKELYEIVDGNDLPFKYMLKTAGDQFQAVGMKKVDLKKLEDILNDGRLSDVIKEDIIRFANKIEEEGQDTASLTIYSPNLIEATNITSKTKKTVTIASYWQPTVYYTGYGYQRYKDEVLCADNYVSQTGETDFSNSQFAQDWYNKLFFNAAQTFLGEIAQKNAYTNILAKLVDIFGADPYVGGSEGDKIKVFLIEDKWRKYTSIMYPYSDYKLGAISDQFWLDVYTDKIQDGIVTRDIQNTFMRNQDYLYTDQRAYQYKSSLGYWDNRTTQHEFYGIKFWTAL